MGQSQKVVRTCIKSTKDYSSAEHAGRPVKLSERDRCNIYRYELRLHEF